MPIQLQTKVGADSTWGNSFTKLLVFNQTQYDRVLSLDSDAVVLQPLDELFLLPSVPVAMPRAYWLDPEKRILGSHVLLVEPSASEFKRVSKAMNKAKANEYDMDVLNNIYRDSAMVLPHRQYSLLTGEFRSTDHAAFLGSNDEEFDPDAVMKRAKYIHFSDWPVPKVELSQLLLRNPGV
ncbi:N-acetylglucosaminyltransferase [Ascosphaera pollenicola]|nr:N-acetylglucosaminyltransferase [Ascosphaera pollenicola]